MTEQQLLSRLRARRVELVERKQRVQIELSHREQPIVADFADGALQRENDETLSAIDQTIDIEITAIDKALARWKVGMLGICESCGEAIPSTRLAAVPYAVTCTRCARR